MLKKLTNKNRQQKKECFKERIATGCINHCGYMCGELGYTEASAYAAARDALG